MKSNGQYVISLDKKKWELFNRIFMYPYITFEDYRREVLAYFFDCSYNVTRYGTKTSVVNMRQFKTAFLRNRIAMVNIMTDKNHNLIDGVISSFIITDEDKFVLLSKEDKLKNMSYKMDRLTNVGCDINDEKVVKGLLTEGVTWENFLIKKENEFIGGIAETSVNQLLNGKDEIYRSKYKLILKAVEKSGIKKTLKLGSNDIEYFTPIDLATEIYKNGWMDEFKVGDTKVFALWHKKEILQIDSLIKYLDTGTFFFKKCKVMLPEDQAEFDAKLIEYKTVRQVKSVYEKEYIGKKGQKLIKRVKRYQTLNDLNIRKKETILYEILYKNVA